jgi:hypothetical protein
MNGTSIKGLIYLLFLATIFYFIVGIVFKIIKFNKLSKLNKGIYFSTFILIFYFFYKVIPSLLSGKNKLVESMGTMMDELSKKSTDDVNKKSDTGSGDIDYTKGWDTADNFRANYCSKNPILLDAIFFEKDTGNDSGGLVYGFKSELYDKETKKPKQEYIDAYVNQTTIFDINSFTKENGCITNLKADNNVQGGSSQMCNPKCNWSFKKKSENKK